MKNSLRTLAISVFLALAALPWIFPIPQPALAACTFLCNDGAGNGEFGANLQVDGNLTVLGTTTGGVYQTSGLRITGTTAIVPNSSEGTLYASATGGGVFRGSGSSFDISLLDQNGSTMLGASSNRMRIGAAGSTSTIAFFQSTPLDYVKILAGGTLASGGSSTIAVGMLLNPTITGATGDTAYQTGLAVSPAGITTQGATETIGIVSSLRITEPNITVGAGDTITNAATVAIISAPTEGATNDALLVQSGTSRFGGGAIITGTTALAPASSQGTIYASATEGGIFRGSGSGADFALKNQAGTTVIGNVANTALMTISATAFGSLGTPANGSFAYCNDCTIANPCAGGGNGAFAKRLNGAWVCN